MGLKSMIIGMGLQKHPLDVDPKDELLRGAGQSGIGADAEFADKYDELASKLGVKCLTPKTSKLESILAKMSIDIYDTAKVERYMDAKGHWAWFPLRVVDIAPGDNHIWLIERETPTDYASLYGASKRTIYDKPVPYPVLCTVKSLADELGSQVLFLVAALDKHPDPFLACRLREDLKLYVIERWDEPSFR